jgi:hypothetical protein
MILARTIVIALSLMALHCSSSDGGDGGALENSVSLLFDGEDDYGSAGDIFITLGPTIDRCSISLWFKPEATPAAGSMMLQLNPEFEGGVNAMQVSLYWEASDRVGLHLTPDFEGVPGAMLFADLEDQEGWNHVLVTFDSGAASDNVRLYLNGEEVGSADQGAPMESVGNIQFARQGSGINHYNGYLDEAAIWDTALTGEEVASVYRNGTPGNVVVDYASYRSSTALSSFWRMGDENKEMEPNVSDRIGGNHFTIVNGGAFSTETP